MQTGKQDAGEMPPENSQGVARDRAAWDARTGSGADVHLKINLNNAKWLFTGENKRARQPTQYKSRSVFQTRCGCTFLEGGCQIRESAHEDKANGTPKTYNPGPSPYLLMIPKQSHACLYRNIKA